MESDHRKICVSDRSIAVLILSTNLDNNSAADSSSLGRDMLLIGAT